MRALVLKDLPYSADGVRISTLPAGQEADIRDDLFKGLKDAGYIRELDGALVAPQPPHDALSPVGGVEDGPAAFDATMADLDALRAFLKERGVKFHHLTGEAKLRELAAEALKG